MSKIRLSETLYRSASLTDDDSMQQARESVWLIESYVEGVVN
jgi:hypothetical protein